MFSQQDGKIDHCAVHFSWTLSEVLSIENRCLWGDTSTFMGRGSCLLWDLLIDQIHTFELAICENAALQLQFPLGALHHTLYAGPQD